MPITRPTLTKAADRGVRDGSSYSWNTDLNSVASKRKIWVKWDERLAAVQRYVGFSQIEYNAGVPVRLMRLTPLQYHDSSFLYATGVTDLGNHKQTSWGISGADDSAVAIYDKLDLEIKYERLPYFVKEDADVPANQEDKRFVSISDPRVTIDYVTLPRGWIQFVKSDSTKIGGPINYNVGKVLPIWEYTFTWHRLPEDITSLNSTAPEQITPWDRRIYGQNSTYPKSYLGTINKVDFFGFPAGTILFTSYRLIRRAAPIDAPWWVVGLSKGIEYDIEYDFAFDPHGWNFKYYFDTTVGAGNQSGWYFVRNKKSVTYHAPGTVPDDESLYNERDLYDMFKVML